MRLQRHLVSKGLFLSIFNIEDELSRKGALMIDGLIHNRFLINLQSRSWYFITDKVFGTWFQNMNKSYSVCNLGLHGKDSVNSGV